jgi:hypothetical protein
MDAAIFTSPGAHAEIRELQPVWNYGTSGEESTRQVAAEQHFSFEVSALPESYAYGAAARFPRDIQGASTHPDGSRECNLHEFQAAREPLVRD